MKNESAFPTVRNENEIYIDEDGKPHTVGPYSGGLTKREYFAAKALQGLLSAIYTDEKILKDFSGDDNGRTAVSRNAISYADALIAALEKDSE